MPTKNNGDMMFLSSRPVPLIVLTIPPEIGIDGRLEEPLTLSTRLTNINNTLNSPDPYSSSVYFTLKGIPAHHPEHYHNKDYPGSQIMHSGDWDARDYGFYYWGPGSAPVGGFRAGHTDNPEVAITAKGLFWHDDRKTYTINHLYDYKGAYDLYPWDAAPPFGDLDEEWEFRIKRRYDGTDIYLSIELTGSNHVGTTYTISEILVSTAEEPSDSALDPFNFGRPVPHAAHFFDFPLGMQLLAARLVFDETSGIVPTIETFTIESPIDGTMNEGRQWICALTASAQNEPPGVVTGYYISTEGTPAPLPLPGVFTATPPPNVYFSGAGQPNGIDTGLRTMYLWACNDTMDVSARAEAQVFLCDTTRNGVPGRGILHYDRYAANSASANPPLHIGLLTPFPGDALTYTITEESRRDGDGNFHTSPGLFTMVGDELQLDTAPTDESDIWYYCQVTVEDEHGNKALTSVLFLRPGYNYW